MDESDYEEDNIIDDEEDDNEEDDEEDIDNIIFEDEIDVIQQKAEEYIGVPFLTKFEKARVLSVRTHQITCGAKIFIETNLKDPFEIAVQELISRRCPLIIRRYFNNKFIDISVNKLQLI